MVMSFLLVGFGSIGRRHLRNLQTLGYDDISVYRTGKSTLPTDELDNITVYYDLDEALAQQPTATIIANPSSLHIPTALKAAQAGSHLFLEKPVSHNLEGVEALQQIVAEKNLITFVGFQLRFHPALQQVKQWLDAGEIGQVVNVQSTWSEYLPDWHPWEDYRQSYSAREDLGGGVTLTLCHPLDYLYWLFGDVTHISANLGYRGLDIKADDTADINLTFTSGVLGNVHLDYLGRPPELWLNIIGTEGRIKWDNADSTARLYRPKTERWHVYTPDANFERNTMFLAEMQHFTNCLTQAEQSSCTLDDGLVSLRWALKAKLSHKQHQTVNLTNESKA